MFAYREPSMTRPRAISAVRPSSVTRWLILRVNWTTDATSTRARPPRRPRLPLAGYPVHHADEQHRPGVGRLEPATMYRAGQEVRSSACPEPDPQRGQVGGTEAVVGEPLRAPP